MAEGYDEPIRKREAIGIRTMILGSYEIPRYFYATGVSVRDRRNGSAARWAGEIGIITWYAAMHPSRRKRVSMDVDKMVGLWKDAIVGLAIAHDKDEADRYEANIETCLTPMLTAPVAQLREFAIQLMAALRSDPRVPYLVWRAYEVWMLQMKSAPDEDVKELKRELAKQIVDLVEVDAKNQLPEAMVRALMWRAPEKLEEVRDVVTAEKAAGRSVRMRGRESCLFLEAGGTEDEPKVCVQI